MARRWIMIAGPYRSGTKSAQERAENLRLLNRAALTVWQKGHMPVIGVNNALPLIDIAGEHAFDSLMMPISLEAAERCDACLRIGGASNGADEEVARFRRRGLPVYFDLDEIDEV